jgi:anti-sigma regulatory factor (Ser/Thr protein kinase)
MREQVDQPVCAEELIQCLVDALGDFTGPGWEQEDDVTFVSISRDAQAAPPERQASRQPAPVEQEAWQLLAAFDLPSQPGNERDAMERVASALKDLGLSEARLERLKTAVAEATINAMEHGNHYHPHLPAEIEILLSRSEAKTLIVRIRDHGGSQAMPPSEAPNLDAKLAGLQSPRGWGLFLIKNMVDEVRVSSDEVHHIIDLILYLDGGAA